MPSLKMARLETKKALLRRGEVKSLLGISEQEMSQFVQDGIIKPHHLRDNSRAYYLRTQIEKYLSSLEKKEAVA